MKFMIETGSESHATSSASCLAKFVGGERDGQFLYQHKAATVSTEWHMIGGGKHGRWVTTVYELPAGTDIEIIGKGRTGARGADKWEFHRIYRLDESAEVQDFTVAVGLRHCAVKGRMVFVLDLIKHAEESLKQSQEEGF